MLTSSAVCLLVVASVAEAADYALKVSHAGQAFFHGFEFAPGYDNTTNGDTFWATAANTSLAYVTETGTVMLKVDTGNVVYNEKRWAPKLYSKDTYDLGTVLVVDSIHNPYGCSVWGALWTQGPDWPNGGEIDFMEGINNQATNQIALHANAGCTASENPGIQSGRVSFADCDQAANFGSGCTVIDPNPNSYGQAFADNGGGVYVVEMAATGINVWFWSRANVPAAVTKDAKSIDTSTLGLPVASYLNETCDIKQFFKPQTLTVNIALCGDWAGIPDLLAQTCPPLEGEKTCYTTYVIDDGANYASAFFELNYINVYTATSAPSSSASPAASTSASLSATAFSTAGVPIDGITRPSGVVLPPSGGNQVTSRFVLYGGTAAVVAALLIALI